MAVQPTYPGVYIQEVPSGVRTITGVSTSVTAFVGTAKRGPINKAVHLFSYSDYEKRFGGLDKDSQMSYAIRQFYLNGGSQAIAVRVAKNPMPAKIILKDATSRDSLEITALEEGSAGNNIEIQVNYNTTIPDSTFNIVAIYISPDNPSGSISEAFSNLSMNSDHPRYVENVINGVSELIEVNRKTPDSTITALGIGEAYSGELVDALNALKDVSTLVDASHNSFRVALNGTNPVNVVIDSVVLVGTNIQKLIALCNDIQIKVRASGIALLADFTCTRDVNKIKMRTGNLANGEKSRIQILPGIGNDASNVLKLGVANGGSQKDAVAVIRPVETPEHAMLTSGELAPVDVDGVLPDVAKQKFSISIDNRVPDIVDIGSVNAAGADHQEKMLDIAQRIQTTIQGLKPNIPSYRNFQCKVIDSGAGGKKLVLTPGSRGANSSIIVTTFSGDTLATDLNLLVTGIASTATRTQPTNTMLTGGNESPFNTAEAYNIYIGSRANREGLYALEEADLFNLLCLPGISDGSIIMDSEAYCRERRAFMIVDPPQTDDKPAEIRTKVTGTTLPKSDHAAIYYPWLRLGDPLNNGQLKSFPPSGTMAGLYARIDANRGVWKAPAGTEANLVGVQGLDYKLTDGENGSLNPLGVNCLRIFPSTGAVSWGARTLAGSDQLAHEYKYLSIRRTVLFIEESLFRGLKWVVFEPNDEPLWAQIRLNVGAFMHNLFRQGAFQGRTKKEAYFVKCDKETTTQNDINLGIVNVWVGFAPLKPAEFVILYLQQMTGEIQV